MIASVIERMNLEHLGAMSTVLFFLVFVAVTLEVCSYRKREDLERQAALPLDDGNNTSSKE